MYANFTEETCTGTGNTLTLSGATAGSVPFAQSFADGQPVSYSVEDSAGVIKITGIGTYNSTGDTITRDDDWSWNGTTVNTNPSTNITLSGGTHTIRCDVTRNNLVRFPTALAAGSDGYVPHEWPGSPVAVTMVDNSISLDFFICETKAVRGFTKIAYQLTTSGAGTETLILGIYEISQDLTTATLLQSTSSTVVANTAETNVTLSAYTLEYGKIYALAAITDDASTFRIKGQSTHQTNSGVFGSQGLTSNIDRKFNNEYAITAGWSSLPASIDLTTGGAISTKVFKGVMKP